MRTTYTNNHIEEMHDYCIDITDRTIFLHGHTLNVEEDNGVDFRMANRLLKNILYLDKQPDNITIHQHSIGGEWESGMLIFDAVATSRSHIDLVCHGEVMSMGTIILQAADTRYAMPNCHFLFHFGETGVGYREYIAGISWIEMEKRQTKIMMDIYASKCKNSKFFKDKSETQIKKFLDQKFKNKADWHLDSEEAKYYGFIDKIIDVDCELKDL